MPADDPVAATVWLTGLPCSGKTTLAGRLRERLRERAYRAEVLDGDVLRSHMSGRLGFTKEDREANVRLIGLICELLSRNGVIAIAAAVSPYRYVREAIRSMIGSAFIEVYVRCPLEICVSRDSKGMYRKAIAGEIKGFTGLDDPYEPPLDPELELRTDHESIDESLDKIVDVLEMRGYVDLSTVPRI